MAVKTGQDKMSKDIRENLRKVANSSGRYFQGTAKLFLASGKDLIKQKTPTLTGMIEINKDLITDVSRFLKNPSDAIHRAADTAMQSESYGALKRLMEYTVEDLKSGNFYDPDRDRTEFGMDTADLLDNFGDFDMSGFDENGDYDDDSLYDEKAFEQEVALQESHEKASDARTIATIDAIQKSGLATVQTQKANAQADIRLGIKQHAQLMSGVQNLVTQQGAILQAVNTAAASMLEVTRAAHEEVMEGITNITELLAAIEENTHLYDAENPLEEENPKDIFGIHGELDIRNWLKAVGNNAAEKYGLSGMLSMGTSMLSQDNITNILESVMSNPLQMVTDGIIKKVLPDYLKSTINTTKTYMENFLPSLLNNFAERGKRYDADLLAGRQGKISDMLLGMLGVQERKGGYIDMTPQNPMGAANLSNKTIKAIEEVIPMWLSKIYSAVSGDELSMYNYVSGRIENVTQKIADTQYDVGNLVSRMGEATREFTERATNNRYVAWEDEQMKKDFEQYTYRFLQKAAENGSFINPWSSDEDFDRLLPDDVNKELFGKLLRSVGYHMPRKQLMKMNSEMQDARRSQRSANRQTEKDLLDSGTGIMLEMVPEELRMQLESSTMMYRYGLDDKKRKDVIAGYNKSVKNRGEKIGVLATNQYLDDIVSLLRRGIVVYPDLGPTGKGGKARRASPEDTLRNAALSDAQAEGDQILRIQNRLKMEQQDEIDDITYKNEKSREEQMSGMHDKVWINPNTDITQMNIAQGNYAIDRYGARFSDSMMVEEQRFARMNEKEKEKYRKEQLEFARSKELADKRKSMIANHLAKKAKGIGAKLGVYEAADTAASFGDSFREATDTPFRMVDLGLRTIDQFMFKVLYGEDAASFASDEGIDEDDISLMKAITKTVQAQWKTATDWFTENIGNPMKEFFFGQEGLFPRIRERGIDLFNAVKGRLTGQKGEDGTYSGGMFSNVMNRAGTMKDGLLAAGKEKLANLKNRYLYGTADADSDNVKSKGRISKFVEDRRNLVGTSFNKKTGKMEYTYKNADGTTETLDKLRARVEIEYAGLMGRVQRSFDDFKDMMFGPDKDGNDHGSKEKFNLVSGELKKAFPDMTIGAGIGVIGSLFLPGGPMLGALLGSTAGLVTGSEKFKEFLFGKSKKKTRKKYNMATGLMEEVEYDSYDDSGIFSSQIIDGVKQYFPKMATGAVVGRLVGGGLMPGVLGQAVGTVAGSIVGMVASSDKLKQIIFGDMEKGEDDGIISKRMRDGIARIFTEHAPGAIAGGLTGAKIGGMIGAGVGLIPGLALAGPIATMMGGIVGVIGGDTLQSIFFGETKEVEKPDPNNPGKTIKVKEKVGGLFGKAFDYTQEHIFKPFGEKVNKLGDTVSNWFDSSVVGPLARSVEPVKEAMSRAHNAIKDTFLNIGNSIKESLDRTFENAFGSSLHDFFEERVMGPLKKMTNSIFSGIGKAIGAVLSAPFKAVEFIFTGKIGGEVPGEKESKPLKGKKTQQDKAGKDKKPGLFSAAQDKEKGASMFSRFRESMSNLKADVQDNQKDSRSIGDKFKDWKEQKHRDSLIRQEQRAMAQEQKYKDRQAKIAEKEAAAESKTSVMEKVAAKKKEVEEKLKAKRDALAEAKAKRQEAIAARKEERARVRAGLGTKTPSEASVAGDASYAQYQQQLTPEQQPQYRQPLPYREAPKPAPGAPTAATPGAGGGNVPGSGQHRKEPQYREPIKQQAPTQYADPTTHTQDVQSAQDYTKLSYDKLKTIDTSVKGIYDEVKGQLGNTGWNLGYIKVLLEKRLGKLKSSELPEEMEGSTRKSVTKRRGILGKLGHGVGSILGNTLGLGGKVVGSVLEGVNNIFANAANILLSPVKILGNALAGLTNAVGTVTGALFKTAGSLLAIIAKGATAVLSGVTQVVANTLVGATKIITGAAVGIGKALGNVASLFTGVLKDLTLAVTGVASGLVRTIGAIVPEVVGPIIKGMATVGKTIAKGIWGGVKMAGKGVGWILSNTVGRLFGMGGSKGNTYKFKGDTLVPVSVGGVENKVAFPYVKVAQGKATYAYNDASIPVYLTGADNAATVYTRHAVPRRGDKPDVLDKLYNLASEAGSIYVHDQAVHNKMNRIMEHLGIDTEGTGPHDNLEGLFSSKADETLADEIGASAAESFRSEMDELLDQEPATPATAEAEPPVSFHDEEGNSIDMTFAFTDEDELVVHIGSLSDEAEEQMTGRGKKGPRSAPEVVKDWFTRERFGGEYYRGFTLNPVELVKRKLNPTLKPQVVDIPRLNFKKESLMTYINGVNPNVLKYITGYDGPFDEKEEREGKSLWRGREKEYDAAGREIEKYYRGAFNGMGPIASRKNAEIDARANAVITPTVRPTKIEGLEFRGGAAKVYMADMDPRLIYMIRGQQAPAHLISESGAPGGPGTPSQEEGAPNSKAKKSKDGNKKDKKHGRTLKEWAKDTGNAVLDKLGPVGTLLRLSGAVASGAKTPLQTWAKDVSAGFSPFIQAGKDATGYVVRETGLNKLPQNIATGYQNLTGHADNVVDAVFNAKDNIGQGIQNAHAKIDRGIARAEQFADDTAVKIRDGYDALEDAVIAAPGKAVDAIVRANHERELQKRAREREKAVRATEKLKQRVDEQADHPDVGTQNNITQTDLITAQLNREAEIRENQSHTTAAKARVGKAPVQEDEPKLSFMDKVAKLRGTAAEKASVATGRIGDALGRVKNVAHVVTEEAEEEATPKIKEARSTISKAKDMLTRDKLKEMLTKQNLDEAQKATLHKLNLDTPEGRKKALDLLIYWYNTKHQYKIPLSASDDIANGGSIKGILHSFLKGVDANIQKGLVNGPVTSPLDKPEATVDEEPAAGAPEAPTPKPKKNAEANKKEPVATNARITREFASPVTNIADFVTITGPLVGASSDALPVAVMAISGDLGEYLKGLGGGAAPEATAGTRQGGKKRASRSGRSKGKAAGEPGATAGVAAGVAAKAAEKAKEEAESKAEKRAVDEYKQGVEKAEKNEDRLGPDEAFVEATKDADTPEELEGAAEAIKTNGGSGGGGGEGGGTATAERTNTGLLDTIGSIGKGALGLLGNAGGLSLGGLAAAVVPFLMGTTANMDGPIGALSRVPILGDWIRQKGMDVNKQIKTQADKVTTAHGHKDWTTRNTIRTKAKGIVNAFDFADAIKTKGLGKALTENTKTGTTNQKMQGALIAGLENIKEAAGIGAVADYKDTLLKNADDVTSLAGNKSKVLTKVANTVKAAKQGFNASLVDNADEAAAMIADAGNKSLGGGFFQKQVARVGKVAGKAVNAVKKSGVAEKATSLVDDFMKAFSKHMDDFFKSKTMVKFLQSKAGKGLAKAKTAIVNYVKTKVGPKLATETGKYTAGSVVKGIATIMSGGTFLAVMAVKDFMQGYNSANEYFNVYIKDCTFAMKLISGLMNAVGGLLSAIGGPIGPVAGMVFSMVQEPLVQLLYKLLSTDEEQQTLAENQNKLKDQVAQYNEEHGTDYTEDEFTKDFNEDGSMRLGAKIGKFFGFKSDAEKRKEKAEKEAAKAAKENGGAEQTVGDVKGDTNVTVNIQTPGDTAVGVQQPTTETGAGPGLDEKITETVQQKVEELMPKPEGEFGKGVISVMAGATGPAAKLSSKANQMLNSPVGGMTKMAAPVLAGSAMNAFVNQNESWQENINLRKTATLGASILGGMTGLQTDKYAKNHIVGNGITHALRGAGKVLAGESLSVESGLNGAINKLVTKIFGNKTVQKMFGKFAPKITKVVSTLTKFFKDKVIPRVMSEGGQDLVKNFGKNVLKHLTAILNIAFAIKDFISGYRNAGKYFPDVQELTFGMKLTSAICNSLGGLTSMIPVAGPIVASVLSMFMDELVPIVYQMFSGNDTMSEDDGQSSATATVGGFVGGIDTSATPVKKTAKVTYNSPKEFADAYNNMTPEERNNLSLSKVLGKGEGLGNAEMSVIPQAPANEGEFGTGAAVGGIAENLEKKYADIGAGIGKEIVGQSLKSMNGRQKSFTEVFSKIGTGMGGSMIDDLKAEDKTANMSTVVEDSMSRVMNQIFLGEDDPNASKIKSKTFFNKIKDGIGNVFNNVKDGLGDALNTARETINNVWTNVQNWWSDITQEDTPATPAVPDKTASEGTKQQNEMDEKKSGEFSDEKMRQAAVDLVNVKRANLDNPDVQQRAKRAEDEYNRSRKTVSDKVNFIRSVNALMDSTNFTQASNLNEESTNITAEPPRKPHGAVGPPSLEEDPILGYGKGRWGTGVKPMDQTATKWNKSDSLMSKVGCGPTAAAMVGSAYGDKTDPAQANALSKAAGMRASDGGTNPDFFSKYSQGKNYGMQKGPVDGNAIASNLSKGQPVVMMGKGGSYGKNMHYMVADKMDRDGNVGVVDPIGGSRKNVPMKDLAGNASQAIYSYGKGLGVRKNNDVKSIPGLESHATRRWGKGPVDAETGEELTQSEVAEQMNTLSKQKQAEENAKIQQALVDHMASINGRISYSQSGSQNPDNGSASCASTVAWAYNKVLGFRPGGSGFASSSKQSRDSNFTTIYTKNSKDDTIPVDIMQPGDIVYYKWGSTNKTYADLVNANSEFPLGHTEMYAGNGQNWSHGGPDKGPSLKNINNNSVEYNRRKNAFLVRRYTPFLNGEDPYKYGKPVGNMDIPPAVGNNSSSSSSSSSGSSGSSGSSESGSSDAGSVLGIENLIDQGGWFGKLANLFTGIGDRLSNLLSGLTGDGYDESLATSGSDSESASAEDGTKGDTDTSSNSSGFTPSDTVGSVNSKDFTASVWNYLREKGLSPEATAGIMGNLEAESGISPINVQNGTYMKGVTYAEEDARYIQDVLSGKHDFVNDSKGYGLAQWTYYTRKQALMDYLKSQGKDITSGEGQLGFLFKELGDRDLLGSLNGSSTIKDASNIILHKFEKPKNQGPAVEDKRASFSQKWYDKYAPIEQEKDRKLAEELASRPHGAVAPPSLEQDDAVLGYGPGLEPEDMAKTVEENTAGAWGTGTNGLPEGMSHNLESLGKTVSKINKAMEKTRDDAKSESAIAEVTGKLTEAITGTQGGTSDKAIAGMAQALAQVVELLTKIEKNTQHGEKKGLDSDGHSSGTGRKYPAVPKGDLLTQDGQSDPTDIGASIIDKLTANAR